MKILIIEPFLNKNIDEVEEKIARMNVFLNDNIKMKNSLENLKNNYKNLEVIEMSDTDTKNSKTWLALTAKGTNKLETLKKLCIKLDIDINEVIFFGDGANDLSIISQVGLGVAMGNALEEVKNQAKEITLSNDENGIADFLERII